MSRIRAPRTIPSVDTTTTAKRRSNTGTLGVVCRCRPLITAPPPPKI
jgi:hypothetical protein